MSAPPISYNRWAPLSLAEVTQLLAGAPFTWGIAGGYAVELFVGRAFRAHSDIDILVFRDEQLRVQGWLQDWQLYAADPPGSLRPWGRGELLPYGIHDIWGHELHRDAWQLQLMLAETDGNEWFSRRDHRVRGRRDDLIVTYQGLPCLRIEVQLLYKARNTRPKDQQDFEAALPLLDTAARTWLRDQLRLLEPDGHPWCEHLGE